MNDLAKDAQIAAFRHYSFWKCMDTIREREELEEMWLNNPAWKNW